MDMARMDVLSSILFKLAQDMPSVSASIARQSLQTMSELLHNSLGTFSSRTSKPINYVMEGTGLGAAWPHPYHLMSLQLMGRLFPTSDFRHAVTTGAMLYMGQCLALCPLDSTRSVLLALTLCSVALAVTWRIFVSTLIYICVVRGEYRPVNERSRKRPHRDITCGGPL